MQPRDGKAELAYILKGFPRFSETFISNEIHLLETMGMKLALFAVKRGEVERVHDVVRKIEAAPCYLPPTTSISKTKLWVWLAENVPAYAASHRRLMARRPLAYLQTFAMALGMTLKYRKGLFAKPRKVYVKEFLQAGFIADEILKRGSVRHLHGHFCHGVTNITWYVSRFTGLPFSFTAHAKDIYRSELNPGDLLERKLDAARFITTCTAANEIHLRKLRPDIDKLHTIYHGLDTDYFTPSRREDVQSPAPVILSVGRFVEKKGFNYLVDACAGLKRRGLRFRCIIVGERGDKRDDRYDDIARKIAEHGLEGMVELRAAVTQQELKGIYRQATMFVLPCLVTDDGDRDGIPNVLAEAMAMGLPVVSTSISGIPEIVQDGTHGILVPEKDAAAVEAAIAQLLERPDLRDRLAQASRDRICNCFDSRKTTQALKQLFVDSINARQARA